VKAANFWLGFRSILRLPKKAIGSFLTWFALP
jgi:hypothetical protein